MFEIKLKKYLKIGALGGGNVGETKKLEQTD